MRGYAQDAILTTFCVKYYVYIRAQQCNHPKARDIIKNKIYRTDNNNIPPGQMTNAWLTLEKNNFFHQTNSFYNWKCNLRHKAHSVNRASTEKKEVFLMFILSTEATNQ